MNIVRNNLIKNKRGFIQKTFKASAPWCCRPTWVRRRSRLRPRRCSWGRHTSQPWWRRARRSRGSCPSRSGASRCHQQPVEGMIETYDRDRLSKAIRNKKCNCNCYNCFPFSQLTNQKHILLLQKFHERANRLTSSVDQACTIPISWWTKFFGVISKQTIVLRLLIKG